MMNPYTCDKCDWEYVWTMGDRSKAVKWHELAHIVEGRLNQRSLGVQQLMLAERIAREARAMQRRL